MKTLTIMPCCFFIGVMMSCENQHHKESSKTPENTDNSVTSTKEVPKEIENINRFLDPNKYHETYIMHIVRDLRKHEAGGRSIFLPERGSALKVNGITVVHTKYGDIKVRYLMREGPFKSYNMSTDKWEHTE